MAEILDSKEICNGLETEIKERLRVLPGLCLASVIIGQDYSAQTYQNSQKQTADKLGIKYLSVELLSGISFEDFKSKIVKLNRDESITGIIINKPFPSGWKDVEVFSLLDENKDIEGMHPVNLGKFLIGEPMYISPTVNSIIKLFSYCGVKAYAKKAVVVGFSSLIGKPLALWLANEFATVSITHIATYEAGDLEEYIKNADIIISAVGKPNLIKGEWIKQGAVVIDAGIVEEQGVITGDVEFDKAKEKASFITPVPGGVGKLTTMFLHYNLIIAAENYQK
ncbi:MAG: bifunctional 5,10-methylenetetrahydrofolate dehydrogenase/5,10-methenyltetrahydrofolate cyclohydrolase [Candidatus Omnitrophota bacterium]